ncbi:MAG TPA: hypothetical protein IGS52_11230 [Oscillatoriaceae cyanobacterium M33_DOE_052]|nr:hypothetical protein [Oscillatoriaceae cyanobacterium M33_DOE_052]
MTTTESEADRLQHAHPLVIPIPQKTPPAREPHQGGGPRGVGEPIENCTS